MLGDCNPSAAAPPKESAKAKARAKPKANGRANLKSESQKRISEAKAKGSTPCVRQIQVHCKGRGEHQGTGWHEMTGKNARHTCRHGVLSARRPWMGHSCPGAGTWSRDAFGPHKWWWEEVDCRVDWMHLGPCKQGGDGRRGEAKAHLGLGICRVAWLLQRNRLSDLWHRGQIQTAVNDARANLLQSAVRGN